MFPLIFLKTYFYRQAETPPVQSVSLKKLFSQNEFKGIVHPKIKILPLINQKMHVVHKTICVNMSEDFDREDETHVED